MRAVRAVVIFASCVAVVVASGLWVHAQQSTDASLVLGPSLAVHRAVPWRARQWRHGRSRPAAYVLLWLCRRWPVEDHQCGPHLGAGIRLAADCLDRRRDRCPLESVHHLCRHRRERRALADHVRQRHVQVHRCRQDVDAHRSREHAADWPRGRRPSRSEHRLCRGAGTCLRSESRPRRLPLEKRRRHVGEGALQERERRRDRPVDGSHERARHLCESLEYAASALEHLRAVVPGQGAACTRRPMAARRGTN